MFKHRYKLELVTSKDIHDFVQIVNTLSGRIVLKDDTGFCVNAKSLLGAFATIEWESLYCESEEPIFEHIEKFVIE